MLNAGRAVDNQIFFSMCSPARDMSAGYHAVSFYEQKTTTSDRRLAVGPFDGRRSLVSLLHHRRDLLTDR